MELPEVLQLRETDVPEDGDAGFLDVSVVARDEDIDIAQIFKELEEARSIGEKISILCSYTELCSKSDLDMMVIRIAKSLSPEEGQKFIRGLCHVSENNSDVYDWANGILFTIGKLPKPKKSKKEKTG